MGFDLLLKKEERWLRYLLDIEDKITCEENEEKK